MKMTESKILNICVAVSYVLSGVVSLMRAYLDTLTIDWYITSFTIAFIISYGLLNILYIISKIVNDN